MADKSIELFKELLSHCNEIDDFVRNLKTFSSNFSNQFKFSELNTNCYTNMYLKNKTVIPRQQFFSKINNLEPTCKECCKFYLSTRNKSIKGLDVQLGKKFESKLLEFLNLKGILCKKGDVRNKIFTDNVIVDKDGKIKAYLEIKYQSSPWIWAFKEENTNRECYEGSPALDIKKLEQQWELVKYNKITSPIYYVFWLDFPCVKGIFFISIHDVFNFYQKEATIFERKTREGDYVDRKSGKLNKGQIKKIHISIYQMQSFNNLIKVLSEENV